MNNKRMDFFRDLLTLIRNRDLLSLLIAGLGALAQSFILLHQLTDCYPYKVMTTPSPVFYNRIGAWGVFLAPGLSCLAAINIGKMKSWIVGIIPLVLCPLIFVGIFGIASGLRELVYGGRTGTNFDGLNSLDVALVFLVYSLKLCGIGVVVGSISVYLITLFHRRKDVI